MNINQNNEPFSELPNESKRFSMIANTLNSNSQYLSAWTDNIGWKLGNTGNCSRKVDVNNTVLSDFDYSSREQKFIFYRGDANIIVIANKENGKVFTIVEDPQDGAVIISKAYDGSITQVFRRIEQTNNTFYLGVNWKDKEWIINNCHNQPSPKERQKITAITSRREDNIYTLVKQESNIDFPTLINEPETLSPPPKLTSLDDVGVSDVKAPKALHGRALIPNILVKEEHLPSGTNIDTNPYYVLNYKKYWHNFKTGFIRPGQRDEYTLEKGIHRETQQSFKDTIGISVGSDEKLKFSHKSSPFKGVIVDELNTNVSYREELDFSTTSMLYPNYEKYDIRYVMYVQVDEYELTRLDGTKIVEPWKVFTDKTIFRQYPDMK